ncbi:hypothetical protein AFR_10350 [Actinoplanes friuliensis DSM 7358]|uniref:Uncharacterized protein n=1 Tax=Actinoplanes friuliensis DSM 7358 TaxID=1246995 RepID=U5VU10_9ACTN|nr:hypothetical protein AFR_10350 [Actinoplanes friuliensis DSM 7358]
MVTLQVEEQSHQDLSDWLRKEPLLSSARFGTTGAPPRPGEMGWPADALQIVANADLLTAVATTLGVWLGTRVRRTKIKITHKGRTIEVESGKNAEAITREILDRLDLLDELDEDRP